MTKDEGHIEIPTGVRFQCVLRSLWLQASLNNSTMQGLGALFCLVPVARWLGLDGADWHRFVTRHQGTFNSNPFIATLGLGALARMEADQAGGDRIFGEVKSAQEFDELLPHFRERVSTPLGAVGDSLFWAAVRPQMVLLGAIAALMTGAVGALVLVVGFAIWQFTFRWRSFGWGWALGHRVSDALKDDRLRRPARIAATASAVLAGVLVAVLIPWGIEAVSGWSPDGLGIVAFAASGAMGATIAYRRRASTWALACGLVLGVVAGVAMPEGWPV
jgi:mannose PTS system EIID component